MLAAVLGSARGGLDELAQLPPCPVFAVNDAAAEFRGRVPVFVTLHPEHLPRWRERRLSLGLPWPRAVIAHEPHPLVTSVESYLWPGMNASGSSGMFAAKVALDRGFRVVLCGVPMDSARAHFNDDTPWTEVEAFRGAWTTALPYLRERVRSLSGWTRELLGPPTPEWLGVRPAAISEGF